jgi:hypothetical protein
VCSYCGDFDYTRLAEVPRLKLLGNALNHIVDFSKGTRSAFLKKSTANVLHHELMELLNQGGME